ncbi:unnamed protein product [Cochlearia groenlandica]
MHASPLQRGLDKLILGGDLPDPSVDYILRLIRFGNKFTHQSWRGGIKETDVLKPRKVEEGESSQFDIHKVIADVEDVCYERVKALTYELANPTGPHDYNLIHVSDGSHKIDADMVESSYIMVRNVVADINTMAAEDSIVGDGSRTTDEPIFEDVENTLNEEAVERNFEHNFTMGNDKASHELDSITNEDVTSHNLKCPRDVEIGPQFNIIQQDQEVHVKLLGYTDVFAVSEVEVPIQPPPTVTITFDFHLDDKDGGESSKNVMEASGAVQEGYVGKHPPTNAWPRKSKKGNYLTKFTQGKASGENIRLPRSTTLSLTYQEKLLPTYDGHTLLVSSFFELLVPASLPSTLHWVGVVVNLSEHELVVLDCNPEVVETPIVDALLVPFAFALPYITRQLAYNSEIRHDLLEPFAITRPPLKTRLTAPELSGIPSFMLMLLHANDN